MKTRIIPSVMTWDGIVTKTHKYYFKELGISNNIEAYMQSLVIKKTLETISLDYRRGEERDQELSQEVTVKLESKPSNKERVNQDTPGEVENKE